MDKQVLKKALAGLSVAAFLFAASFALTSCGGDKGGEQAPKEPAQKKQEQKKAADKKANDEKKKEKKAPPMPEGC